ncbi:hypothetical protein HK104_002751 [Borealophlyctis nickersoniae]|nr:hypothetical protein HK104_002751 [Borealophlyctis nickersoniae]
MGTLLTGNVALQYNTLFLALNGDANHFISHGMSTVAGTNYNIDGVVVSGGVGGIILGQSGQTVLKCLNGVVSIPGNLKVSGATNLKDISILPRNGNDTNPAFSAQAYGHDNVNLYLDAFYNGSMPTYFYRGYIDSGERVKILMSVEVLRGNLIDHYFEITMEDDLSEYLDPKVIVRYHFHTLEGSELESEDESEDPA